MTESKPDISLLATATDNVNCIIKLYNILIDESLRFTALT
jgi:hypothetical protein